MKKLKFAIIGCGRISYKHVEAISNNNDRCELVAVCDVVKEHAEVRKKVFELKYPEANVKVYKDYQEMLKEEQIDVVTLATESGYHGEIALRCILAGKHIAIEKPMAMRLDEADAIIEAATNMQVVVTVCHQNRFNPAVQKMRHAREKGGFGKLVNCTARILWNRNEDYYKQAPWRGTWELDGGTLMNQCIHNIDLLRWMVGAEIDTVYAQCGTFLRPIEAEDFGAIIIRFKDGTIGLVEGSACVYPKNLEETLSLFGEKGTVCLGGMANNKIETWNFEDQILSQEILEEEEVDCVYGTGHTPLFRNLIEAILEKKEPYVTAQDGRNAIEIILSAYESARTGMPIKIER